MLCFCLLEQRDGRKEGTVVRIYVVLLRPFERLFVRGWNLRWSFSTLILILATPLQTVDLLQGLHHELRGLLLTLMTPLQESGDTGREPTRAPILDPTDGCGLCFRMQPLFVAVGHLPI